MLDPRSLGARVRVVRQRAGLSQAQLAERAGVANETISRLERGSFEPSLSTLIAVADVLEVDLDSLVGRATESEAPRAAKGRRSARAQALVERIERLEPRSQRVLSYLVDLLLQEREE